MRKGNLTREQAVELVGETVVARVDGENCDFTNRLQTDGDTAVEFSASTFATDREGYQCVLVAYYYQDQEDLDQLAEDEGELDQLDWEIEGYEVV